MTVTKVNKESVASIWVDRGIVFPCLDGEGIVSLQKGTPNKQSLSLKQI